MYACNGANDCSACALVDFAKNDWLATACRGKISDRIHIFVNANYGQLEICEVKIIGIPRKHCCFVWVVGSENTNKRFS